MAFVESHIFSHNADEVIAALILSHSYRVEAHGYSRGIRLCSSDSVRIDILFSHFQFIHCQVHSISYRSSTLVYFVYASSNSSKMKHLWNYISYLGAHIH
ncbi:hypothetical protein GQ457_08G034170 [Hibiscus cannabinus]